MDDFGWHVGSKVCEKFVGAMNHCKSMATPRSKGQELKSWNRQFRSSAGICQYMTEQLRKKAMCSKRRVSVGNYGACRVGLKVCKKSLLDAMAMNCHVATEKLDPKEHREF